MSRRRPGTTGRRPVAPRCTEAEERRSSHARRVRPNPEAWVEAIRALWRDATHPMSQARAERLKQELAALPKQTSEPFTFEWTTIQVALGVQPAAAP